MIISVPLHPDLLPEARVWRALGAAVEAFVGTVVRATGGLVEAQQRVIEQQAEQLQRSWRIIEALTGHLIAERMLCDQEAAERRADDGARRVRDELVGRMFGELIAMGQVLNADRSGLPAELAEVFALFAKSPELAQALSDPAVRAMLQGERAQAKLAQILLDAARSPGDMDGGEAMPTLISTGE